MITVAELKAKYPHPQTPFSCRQDPYCVMGALRREIMGQKANGFPSVKNSVELLITANENLSVEVAYNFSSNIVAANDAAEFDRAWLLLEEALNHGKP